MRRIKVRRIREGLHPNEVVVSVATADGSEEELVVHKRSLGEGDTLLIGYPIGGDDKNNLLVELPRETVRGSSRIWVPRNSLVEAAA
jgi:hypothetical protein